MHRHTARYLDAVGLAADLHRDQRRRNSDVPYLSHLLAVSALVWEDGGEEDEAIAALLHDSIEDHGDRIGLEEIGARFGPVVAEIVAACTDAVGAPGRAKAAWVPRKAAHLTELEHAPARTLRVVAADKLHNARSLLDDRRVGDAAVWQRFNGRLLGTMWYYHQMVAMLGRRLPASTSRLPGLLATTVSELEALATEDRAALTDAAALAPDGWPPPERHAVPA